MGAGGSEETVIFSSGPEGSPPLYKALGAAQELHRSYVPQNHRQRAAAWSSHKGITHRGNYSEAPTPLDTTKKDRGDYET